MSKSYLEIFENPVQCFLSNFRILRETSIRFCNVLRISSEPYPRLIFKSCSRIWRSLSAHILVLNPLKFVCEPLPGLCLIFGDEWDYVKFYCGFYDNLARHFVRIMLKLSVKFMCESCPKLYKILICLYPLIFLITFLWYKFHCQEFVRMKPRAVRWSKPSV